MPSSITDQSEATNGNIPQCLPVDNPTQCFWQMEGHDLSNHRSTEELPEHSDIVIIGAGYAGVGTAYHLVQELGDSARSVTILEARSACSGATGRNGGHLRPDLYGHIPTYIDRAGVKAGAEIAEFEIAHVRAMKKFIEEENIDCDFTLARSLDIWCNKEAAEKAKAVYDHMVSQNLDYMEDVAFYTGDKVEGVSDASDAEEEASMLTCGRYVVSKAPWHVHRTRPGRFGHTNSLCISFRSSLPPIKSTSKHTRQSYPLMQTKTGAV